MNKISVIVPAYNEEKRIKKCIDSILNQTYKNIEVIVINDGSTDNTLKVLDSISDSRLVVKTIKNSGQGSARNLGIKLSTGSLITFVDSDDYIKNDMIEKLYNSMKENDSDISICNLIKKYSSHEEKFVNFNKLCDDDNVNYMISHSGPVGRLYKKSLFIENNIFFKEKCIYEDLAVIPLLGIYAKKISFIDQELYYYVIRDNSSMNQKKYSKKLEDIFIIMKYLNEQFKLRSDKYFFVLEYLNIEHLLYSAYLRFLSFDEGQKNCIYITKYMKKNYPNYRKNIIYKMKSYKFKIFCFFASKGMLNTCKIIKKLGGK